ncbi:hypothetical protein BGX27_005680 [Mortierella sp. AM989]|nr:hypothetical protein BGX27_005680 [Mortierella sp. AM989]
MEEDFPFSFGNVSDEDEGSEGLFCAPKVKASSAKTMAFVEQDPYHAQIDEDGWFHQTGKSVEELMLQDKNGATKVKMRADHYYMLHQYQEAYDIAQEYCRIVANNGIITATGDGGIRRPDNGNDAAGAGVLKVTDSKEMQEMALRCALKLNRSSEAASIADELISVSNPSLESSSLSTSEPKITTILSLMAILRARHLMRASTWSHVDYAQARYGREMKTINDQISALESECHLGLSNVMDQVGRCENAAQEDTESLYRLEEYMHKIVKPAQEALRRMKDADVELSQSDGSFALEVIEFVVNSWDAQVLASPSPGTLQEDDNDPGEKSSIRLARHASSHLQINVRLTCPTSLSSSISTTRAMRFSPLQSYSIANKLSSTRMLSTANASTFQLANSDHMQQEETTAAATPPTLSTVDPQRIKLAASRSETPLSISQCLKLGESLSTKALLKNLAFLNRELPVRFARRIVELNGLPSDLKETDPFQSLLRNYSMSFDELQSYSDNSQLLFSTSLEKDSDETIQLTAQKEYADLLQAITNRHKQDVIFMAHGISLFKRYQISRSRPSEEIQHFLNSFNRGRLGIRIMVGHHLALQHQFYHPDEPSSSAYLSTPSSAHSRRVGIIEPQCDIEALILRASQSAQFVFFQHYNTVFPPNVHIEHSKELGGKKVRFPVVPALLHHILFELLKNSMRATAEFHGLEKSSYPDGDLNIMIKDHGGGMPSAHEEKLFNYMFTTASNTVCIDFPSIMAAVEKKPMNATLGENLPLCGFGFGLATSRLYARLFHGDLVMKSIAGSGTEASIRLKRLEDQIEQLGDK